MTNLETGQHVYCMIYDLSLSRGLFCINCRPMNPTEMPLEGTFRVEIFGQDDLKVTEIEMPLSFPGNIASIQFAVSIDQTTFVEAPPTPTWVKDSLQRIVKS